MTVESGSLISDFNASNPSAGDQKSEGDDHIRLIKAWIKATFPNITGVVTATHGTLNTAYLPLTGGAVSGTLGSAGLLQLTDTTGAGVNLKMTGDGVTTPNKYLRVTSGSFQVISSDYTTNLFNLDDNGYLGLGGLPALHTLQVRGAGQTVGNMTDAGNKGAAIYLRDTSSAGAGQGGAVLFGAFDSATPMCGIKGYITDAASNTRGDIVFLTRRVATDTALTETMRISAVAGNITDAAGIELGYKGLPQASVTAGAFVAADRGKYVLASGGVTIPNSVMSAGDVVTIHNNTAGNITLTASVASLKLAGTALTGNRVLAQAGIATVLFLTPTIAIISGAGLS